MKTITFEREKQYKNLINNINVLNIKLAAQQDKVTNDGGLPPDTIRDIYKKALEYSQSIVWLQDIAIQHFDDIIKRDVEAAQKPKIITTDN